MRADAKKNYAHILEVARTVVADETASEPPCVISPARQALQLATLLRHFPTREALFEALAPARTSMS